MFGWLSSTVVFASSTKRCTKPRPSASSARICFTTSRFSKPPAPRKVARYTRAMPPARARARGRTCRRSAETRAAYIVPSSWEARSLVGAPRCRVGKRHIIGGHWASTLCRPADAEEGQLAYELEALGDFPPSTDTHESLSADRTLVVPGATRAAWLTASDPFSSYLGLGTATPNGDIDVSLWPAGEFCELPITTPGCDYPGGGEGYAMGVSADGRTLLVAGGDASAEQDAEHTHDVASSAAVVDLATSRATCLPRDAALQVARAGATVTPLGDGLLVAGGYDPDNRDAIGSAEAFDPSTRTFGADPISISARAQHGAVALSTGEVLLVGGRGSSRRHHRTNARLRRHQVAALPQERLCDDLAAARSRRVTALRRSRLHRRRNGRRFSAGGGSGAALARRRRAYRGASRRRAFVSRRSGHSYGAQRLHRDARRRDPRRRRLLRAQRCGEQLVQRSLR